jgi:hypothetical protein
MARINIGGKRVTADAIAKWKTERGYDKPLLFNDQARGLDKLSKTLFVERSLPLFALQFGASDTGRDIGYELRERALPSLAINRVIPFAVDPLIRVRCSRYHSGVNKNLWVCEYHHDGVGLY